MNDSKDFMYSQGAKAPTEIGLSNLEIKSKGQRTYQPKFSLDETGIVNIEFGTGKLGVIHVANIILEERYTLELIVDPNVGDDGAIAIEDILKLRKFCEGGLLTMLSVLSRGGK